MSRFILRRLLFSVLVLAAVTGATFVATLHVGDPVRVILGRHASAEDIAHARRFYGLDKPVTTQLAIYVGHLAHGDLGMSYRYKRPVASLVVERLPRTLLLGLFAIVLQSIVGVSLGSLAAARRGRRTDAAIMATTFVATSTPEFLSGTLLLVGVAYFLGWFPVGGYGVDFGDHLVAAVLPAITLAFAPGAFYARLTRSELTEVMTTDYVRTARAKGLSPAAALVRHALPNALLPVVADLGMSVGSLLGGAVIVETVFGWPGLGKLAYDATVGLDVPVVVGCVVVGTVGVLLGNVLGDLACAWLDPRIRAA